MIGKMGKKIMSVIITLAMVMSLLPAVTLTASAALSGSSKESAPEITVGIATEITTDTKPNYFKFVATVSGEYTILLTGGEYYFLMDLYNSTSDIALAQDYADTGDVSCSIVYSLVPGTYYIDAQNGMGKALACTLSVTTPTNTAPTFVDSGNGNLTVAMNTPAADIKSLLHVSDTDSGQTLTWSESTSPSHGALTFSSATASSGSNNITPGGTITYTPTSGFSGADSFAVQVGDTSAAATRTINVMVDGAAPTVTEKTITSLNVTQTGVTLSWNKATDDISAQTALQYLVYRSSSDNLDTVADIEANGTPIGSYEPDITAKAVSGLTAATTYYFNAIVKDEAGNKTCYTAKSVATSAVADAYFDDITTADHLYLGQKSYIYQGVTYQTDGTSGYYGEQSIGLLSPSFYTGGNTFPEYSGWGIVNDCYMNTGAPNPSTYFSFTTLGASWGRFKLVSMAAVVPYSDTEANAMIYNIIGYREGTGGTPVASVSGFDFRAPSGNYGSENNTIIYDNKNLGSSDYNGGVLTFGSDWNDIDTVVFSAVSGQKDVVLLFDSINFNDVVPAVKASISATPALTEKNLDTSSLTVTLSGTTFRDSTLDASNFSLNNAPGGVNIESVTYTDTTHCTVNLAYDGTDFDANVTTFSLTVKAAELASGSDLTSGTLAITATVELTPTVTAISPASGSAAGGTSVTITGTGFTSGSIVKFGDTAATSVTYNSPTSLTAVSPAGSEGTVDITVTTSGGTSGASISDRFTYDSTVPTILGATRTDDTHVNVTLSEACQNLAKANNGGFMVTKSGTATTYAVSATAAGEGNTVVLTVADMSSAGSAGVTVTYAAGVNGTIADSAGNALVTDSTGKTVAAWDTAAPTVIGVENGRAYNTDKTVTFNEGTATLDGNLFTSGSTVSSEGSHTLTVTDAAGNSTTITFTIDKTPPTGTLSINNGDEYTSSLNVILSITSSDGTGSGVKDMRFSIDGSSWSPWQAVNSTKSGTLTAANYGTLTVYVQFKDNAGNTSGNISDTIIYRSQPVASNSTKVGIEDTTVSFTTDNFAFSNADATPLNKVKIKSLPLNGTLKLGNTTISADDEISAANLSYISFVPNMNWNGDTSFNWVGYDGVFWTSEATVMITLSDDGDTAASASDNIISVSPGTVSTGGTVTITASGNRQSEAGAVIGDEKYIPATWSSSEGSGKSGSFTHSGGTYTASYTPSVGGTYTITAIYQKVIWNGTAWENSTTDTKTATLTVNSSHGGGGGSTSGGNNGAAVIINGETKTAGTSQTTTNSSGQTVTTVTVDSNKLGNVLASENIGATVTIPIAGNSNVAAGTLTGAMIKSMENKAATLVVQTASGAYTLPASEINIDAVSQHLGTNVSLTDIKVTVSISEPSASMTKVIKSAAQDGGFTIVVPAVDYTITCTHGRQTVDVSSFNAYVERTIAIPDGVDSSKITTGVVIDPDGTTHHVPTRVTAINGKYYAVINSLTNSTYSVIWNPVKFSDVANHWANDSINDMGSRMVVTGAGNNNYAPDRNITRAEFATIMVGALGLEPETGASGFHDVNTADWYCGYIKTAASYGVIKGYDNWNFGPNDAITREQAMTMIARAMTITKLSTGLTDSEISRLLSTFSDGESASSYAKEGIAACLKTGITSGTSDTTISPKDDITRAEVAVMVQRLLQKSGLI